MARKSTMVELVDELRRLRANPCLSYEKLCALDEMIHEALAGEYHDYKNKKYVCGKVASSSKLRKLGYAELARRIEDGEFDEEADEQDKEMLKRDMLAGGFTEKMAKDIFDL